MVLTEGEGEEDNIIKNKFYYPHDSADMVNYMTWLAKSVCH